MGMFSRNFWAAAIERAIRTGASAALGLLGAQTLITELHGGVLVAAVGTAMVVDLLTSIVGSTPAAPGEGPSVTGHEEIMEEPSGGAHRGE